MNLSIKQMLSLGAATLGALLPSSGHAKQADVSPFSRQKAVVEMGRHHSSTSSSSSSSTSSSSSSDSSSSSSERGRAKVFKHKMHLYLADCYGFEVPSASFWITMDVIKEDLGDSTRVTLQLPTINFETGPYANNLYELNNPISEPPGIAPEPGIYLPPPQNGGYLYTKDGFLPYDLRPVDVMPRTFFGPSNNGQNIPFTFITNTVSPPPNVSGVIYNAPEAGYLIRITNTGGLVIEGIGTLGNIIPPGTQQLIATDLTYIVKKYKQHICKNTQISKGPINVAQYGIFPPIELGNASNVRDHHVNDAWDNVVAYAWTDNSNIPNSITQPNEMNLAYAIGTVKDGKLELQKAKFLPLPANMPNNMYAWDTAIAINRTDKNNIVISYNLLAPVTPQPGVPYSILCAAVSFDGGKTWPINGPTNIQSSGFILPGTPGGAGDVPGVRSDKFGNFWFMSSNFSDDNGVTINQPYVMVSSDKGTNWELVYTFVYDDTDPIALYDYPAFCFGGDGLGNYGVQIVVDYFAGLGATPVPDNNGYPSRAFIPVFGLGAYGAGSQVFLPEFSNNIYTASITASEDGRVWTYGGPDGLSPAAFPFPGGFTNNRLVFKSPGQLDENYAGPFGVVRYNTLSDSIYYPVWKAAPVYGFFQSVQTNLYDEKREALYVMLNSTYPELANDSEIYFLISRDNGLSWSNPFKLNSSHKNNRGFASMALDTKTGNLLFGWYDGRDFKDGVSFNYWGGIIDAKTLDDLVGQMPKSNPLFMVPAGGF